MLLAESISARSCRYYCLDTLEATFEAGTGIRTESAILLEVWSGGGLLQVDSEVAVGSNVLLRSGPQSVVHGCVQSCQRDEYGCLIEFSVDSENAWFPAAYIPSYVKRPMGVENAR